MTQLDSQQRRTAANLAFFNSELFKTVQTSGLFADSKMFADALPKQPYQEILAAYELECLSANKSDLAVFIQRYFDLPKAQTATAVDLQTDVEQQIQSLWPYLKRQPDTDSLGSLLPLPAPYIVPGGRFREIYYWDSYFSALGLLESGSVDVVEAMLHNFIALQTQYGNIPNGNRSYYLSRSQPPILAMLVELLLPLQAEPEKLIHEAIDAVVSEYNFWMSGYEHLNAENPEYRRVVCMPNGCILNRYWDDESSPRPESYKEDVELSAGLSDAQASILLRNIRAACESGWDFSSRWMKDKNALASIRTTRIVPIDLNCLLYKVELLLADFYQTMANSEQSRHFTELARQRKKAINQYLWSDNENYFMDYDLDENSPSAIKSLAGVLPLFVELANDRQAKHIAKNISDNFLKVGGLVTSNVASFQQWDSPNGWAPLQWFAVKGLLNYRQHPLAKEIMLRWLETVNLYFQHTGKLMEKYNVCDRSCTAGGGEYDVQEGFGWTNGVYQAFLKALKNIN